MTGRENEILFEVVKQTGWRPNLTGGGRGEVTRFIAFMEIGPGARPASQMGTKYSSLD
jgi:hypothetical protein